MAAPKKKYKGRYVRVRKTINGEVKDFYGTSKREAERKRDDYIRKIALGIDPELEKETLYKAMNTWMEVIEKPHLKPSTYDRYAGILKVYIQDHSKDEKKDGKRKENESNLKYGKIAVSDIKTITLQKWYNDLEKEGKSHSQIHNLHKLLNKFFHYAYNEGYVSRNPCAGTRNPAKEEGKEKEVFTLNEIEKVLKSAENSRFYLLIKLLATTGMRVGEALALTWDDVNLEEQLLTINKALNKNRKVTTTKTKSSNRTIIFHASLVPDFKAKKKENAAEKLAIGYEQTDLIFPTPVGTYQDQRNFLRAFKEIVEASGVKYRPPHTLRHSFTSIMRQKGYSLEIIADILGHSSIVTTGDIYSHASKDDLRAAVNSIELLK